MYSVYCVGMLPCCQCTLATVICQSTKLVLLPSACHHCLTTVSVYNWRLSVSHGCCLLFLIVAVCFSPLSSVSHHCHLLLESICILPDMRSQYLNHVNSYLLSDWSDSEVFYHYCSDQVHAGCQDTRTALLRSWSLISEQVMISWFIATQQRNITACLQLSKSTHTHK